MAHPPPCDNLTIVLLCSGSASDPSSYRPNLDETQWWGRRDALVRCVAASLYGPTAGSFGGRTELILLHDEDGSVLRMTSPPLGGCPSASGPAFSSAGSSGGVAMSQRGVVGMDVPTEKNVVSAWRRAAAAAAACASTSAAAVTTRNPPVFRLNDPGPPPGVTCCREPWRTVESENGDVVGRAAGAEAGAGDGAGCAADDGIADDADDVTDLQSKRDVLLHIQKRCPLDFLRRHRLNSSTDVILRKTNRAKLIKVWEEWCGQSKSKSKAKPSGRRTGERAGSGRKRRRGDDGNARIGSDQVELSFRSILLGLGGASALDVGTDKDVDEHQSSPSPRVMAAYLHESCGLELPCFFGGGEETSHCSSDDANAKDDASNSRGAYPLNLCLFLGAVRDMTDVENRALASACSALRVPLVGFRLGPVPEFTSKILTVVGYHRSRGVLGPAAIRLWKGEGRSEQGSGAAAVNQGRRRGRRLLHFVCSVPMRSEAMTPDLSSRTRLHWCLVRVCVCALWRSRLASSAAASTESSGTMFKRPVTAVAASPDKDCSGSTLHLDYSSGLNASLENSLSLIFEDGVVVTIEQEELVTSLAAKHQAAPSEHQILSALCQKRDEVVAKNDRMSKGGGMSKNSSNTVKKACRKLVKSSLEQWNMSCTATSPFVCCLRGFSNNQAEKNRKGLTDLVYSDLATDAVSSGLAVVLLRLKKDSSCADGNGSIADSETSCKIHDALTSALEQANVPMCHQDVVSASNAQDAEATLISMLQHFDYQDRLFPCLKQLCSDATSTNDAPSKSVGSSTVRKKEKKKKLKKKDRKEKKGIAM